MHYLNSFNTLYFFVILVALCFGCKKSNSPNANKTIEQNTVTFNPKKINDSILGSWGVYEFKKNGITTTCTFCPKFQFIDSALVKVTVSVGKSELYTWRLNDQHLKLTSKIERYKPFFPDAKYIIELKKEEHYEELILKINADNWFVLRR